MRSWRNVARLLLECIGVGCLGLLASSLFEAEQCQAFGDSPKPATNRRAETPKAFTDAYDRAKLAWGRLQEGELKPEQTAKLQAEARESFRDALAHSPRDAKADALNELRYCLAYLDWVAGDYYDAAVLGEFLARRYPDYDKAQAGAEIALKAYARLSLEGSAADDRKFEAARMTAIADYIVERWPKSPLADEAWLMQIRAAMAKKDLTKPLEYLGQIAVDSPRRGDAELITGQALWNNYLEALRLPSDRQPTSAEMTKTLSTARKLLEDGIGRLRKPVDDGGEVSGSLAVGTLALAQICLQVGDGAKAVEWLDDPKIGAHTLAKSDNKTINRGNFRVEAFKAALRAYVATQQLDKTKKTMIALEKAGGAGNVARIYMSLGRQLEETLKRLQAEDNDKEAAKVAKSIEFFLDRIAARPAAETTFATLYWVAETFVNLGDSLALVNGKPSPEAMNYYKKAAAAYQNIIAACKADKRFAPQPNSLTAVQIRLARCLRRLGQYEKAMDAIEAILKTNETLIEAQREAAYTYQAWGVENPEAFRLAIRGGRKIKRSDGSIAYLAWGWGGIARRVQDVATHRDIFDEARYNLAICRLKYAQSKKGQERVDLLRQAEQDILIVQRLRPEMGGEKWYGQYDELLRNIQQLLGTKKSDQGLKAAEQRLTPEPKPASK